MKKRVAKSLLHSKKRLRTRFAGLIETLEERLNLSGSYVNASLSQMQSDYLLEGSRSLAGAGDRLDGSGDLARQLGPIKNVDGTPVTPGTLGPFGRTVREGVENPIQDYFDATPVDQRSTDALVAHLGTQPWFLDIEGGLVDGTIDELIFDIHIQREYSLALVDFEFSNEDLPSPFYSKNSLETNLTVVVDVQYVFGIILDPSLSIEQAVFFHDFSSSVQIRIDSVINPFTINLGILEASVPDMTVSAHLDIEVSQSVVTPSRRLSELNTEIAVNLFSTQVGTNDFNATFNLDVGIGRWRLEGSTYFQAIGDFLGFDPAITFSPNFDEVFLFNNITSGELVAGMENFQSWLTSFSNSSQYDISVPFFKSATLGSVYNFGNGMSGFTESLRDEDGNPSFDNAQDFPYSGNGVNYNPDTNKLTFTIIQALPEQSIQSRSTRVEVDDTVGLTSETEALITGSGTVSFVIAVDLSNENVDFRDRISIEDLRVRTTYGTEAVVLTGNAAFNGLGLAYANAILSGQFSAQAIFKSASSTGAALTLRLLGESLDSIGDLLSRDLALTGTSILRLPNLSVAGNLFGIVQDAFVEVSVTDIKNSLYGTTTNVADFLNFENLTFEGLTESLSDAILATEAWDIDGDEAVATLGVSLDDFGPLKQDRIVDALTDAVDEADNAVGFSRRIVQDVADFVQDLDVPSPSGSVQFASDIAYDTATGIFSWFVDASADEDTTVNSGLGFESLFGYTNDSNVSDTDDLVGAQISLAAKSASRLQLGLEFDPPVGGVADRLSNVFLTSRSRLDRTIYVNATPATGNPVAVEGASGAIGMQLRNGSVVIAQNLVAPDPASPAVFSSLIPTSTGRVRVTELPTYQPQKTTLGRLRADFEVVPDHTGNPEPNRLTFQTLNLNNPANSTTVQSSPNFSQMKQGLNLQVNLNAFVPSLEKLLEQLEQKIIDEVLDKAYPLIGDKLEQFANFIEPIREAITTALDAISSFSVSDIENAIEDALRILFNQPNGDFVHVDIQLPTVFKLTLDIDGAPIAVNKTSATNLGLPALGVDWTSEFSVIGSYDFEMSFVLDVNEGFYIETNTERIELALDMDMVGQATGKLGFFEVIATAISPTPGQSAFHAEYVIDVTEPSGDDKLFLKEIGTGPLIDTDTSGLSGEAHMSFSIEAVVSPWLPSIETGLRIDWTFDGIGFGGNNPPVVTYEGIQMHLGPLLSEVFLPFFETINDVFEPMRPIIDILTQPLPVLSDLMDPDPTLIDLAKEVAGALPADSPVRKSIESLAQFIETIATIDSIVKAIQQDSGTGLSLQLGDITFGGTTSPQFDARLNQLDRSVLDLAKETSNLRGQFDGADGAPKLSAELNTSPGSFRLPIIENPLSAIGWILGVDEADLITWDLPNASVTFPIDLEFPVFPGIVAGIFGGLEIGFDFKVGLDTAGFDAYSKSRDVKDLFQGFYVSDRANADGTGEDVNEVFIRGELLAAAGVGATIGGVGVSLTVGGGLFAEIGIDLIDHDHDGKVRGNDFSSGDGCFALTGEFGVAIEARAKAGIFKFELPIAEITVAKVRVVIPCPFYEPPPPAILAGLDPATGTLTLFMGPDAHQRNVQPNVEEESFNVVESSGQIIVIAFGRGQFFDASQVRNIVADGGTKDDRITFIDVSKPSILRGSAGDDVIVGGLNRDFIDGGPGRDELHGGGDNDILIGSFGADLLYGDDGDDDLHGNDGDDDLHGGIGNDDIDTGNGRNIAYGDEGNDTIVGGIFKDILYGGPDNDTIDGGDGSDVLNGEAGIDTIRGQAGDDVIDGGEDDDILYGNNGNDRIYGRTGVDEIYGGDGDDYLNGNEASDFLYGQEGADEIVGELGDDTIQGGVGEDLIYGDQGSDAIDAGPDPDVIYGGALDDTIDGGDGDDEIYGEDGADTLAGNVGNDRIWGGPDSDTIYGYVRDALADSLPAGAPDRDLLYGEQGDDRIAGGPDDDQIYGDESADILLGNEGADWIQGGTGIDSIYGFHLNIPLFWSPVTGGADLADTIFGNEDDDTLYGGPGTDSIRGNQGNDSIFGDTDADTIFGDDGNDTIDGGGDSDTIDGGVGDDFIKGSGGADQLFGNRGFDRIEGNLGADFIAGNDQADLVYGDEDNDTIYGGRGNDTLRGGDQDDTIYGDTGDDLIIGYTGIDTLFGNDGDDVIYGGEQTDTIDGGIGDDRMYGELGSDVLAGNSGNDVIEGGGGDDSIDGGDGNDSLYGDGDQDTIHGGLGNDFLFAGDGVSNLLNGDDGNDVLIGSDEGDEDPKFGDTTFFGDRLNGGDGDDSIDGLGGADEIDGGLGNNIIRGGTHVDRIINGIDQVSTADFQMPTGPDRRGRWSELSRSASLGGLTNVGGFEEAMYVDSSGVYVAWVDWRNGNSDVYVAFHPIGVGGWTPLVGFNGFNSASGGGISNDSSQSRRPTLFKTEDSESLIVAWTSIAPDGTSTIEVVREDTNWTRISNPAQSGGADHAKFVQFAVTSGLLFWIETNAATFVESIGVSQYVHGQGCFDGFLAAAGVAGVGGVGGVPAGKEIKSYDVAAVEFQAVIAIAFGDSEDQDIIVRRNNVINATETTLCPAVPGAKFEEYVSDGWRTLHTLTDGDTQNPTIGIQYIAQRGFVRGEIDLEYDVGVAWEFSTSRENQVDALVIHVVPDEAPTIQPMVPQYAGSAARIRAETISDTLGYADKPDIAMSYTGTFLGWKDDGVFLGDNRSSIFVLSRDRDPTPGDYVMREAEAGDASGVGISETGGSLRQLSMATAEDGFISSSPFVLWNEAQTSFPVDLNGTSVNGTNVYLRVTLDGLQAVDDVGRIRKFGEFDGNVLDNDINLFGEVKEFVSRFDDRRLAFGDSTVEFLSPLGARVTASTNGQVTYNPRGVQTFRALKRGESLTESFIYRVDNFIYEAEAIVEFVVFGTNVWRNERNPLDVDDDSFVSPLDVLHLINDINVNGARELDDIGPAIARFLDVDDDGTISPIDVLIVINWINQQRGNGEGESIEGVGTDQNSDAVALVRGDFGVDFVGVSIDDESIGRRTRGTKAQRVTLTQRP